MSKAPQPNLFLIGAMRAGTTSLHQLLDQHPQIFMSHRKEPMFYKAEEMRRRLAAGQDKAAGLRERLEVFVANGRHRERSTYEALFQNSKNEIYLGESSHYLDSPQVVETIHADCPNARIIVSLRKPDERFYSEYLLYRRTNKRKCSFAEFAHEGCEFDAAGKLTNIGPSSRIGKGFYTRLITPWLNQFGAKNVKIVTFEELSENPIHTAQAVYEWLEIPSTFRPVAVRAQQGGVPKSEGLLSLLDARFPARKLAKKLLPTTLRTLLRSRLYSALLEKPTADPQVECFLREIYKPEIDALEALLDRDFSAWK